MANLFKINLEGYIFNLEYLDLVPVYPIRNFNNSYSKNGLSQEFIDSAGSLFISGGCCLVCNTVSYSKILTSHWDKHVVKKDIYTFTKPTNVCNSCNLHIAKESLKMSWIFY